MVWKWGALQCSKRDTAIHTYTDGTRRRAWEFTRTRFFKRASFFRLQASGSRILKNSIPDEPNRLLAGIVFKGTQKSKYFRVGQQHLHPSRGTSLTPIRLFGRRTARWWVVESFCEWKRSAFMWLALEAIMCCWEIRDSEWKRIQFIAIAVQQDKVKQAA